ncbi:dihydrofolate reductase family protein [Robbsia sp. Bb-Pol-6]|uniref:Dihydrofolate reductase family protein n=1 Tax=Robbsia betulipollinis TaxID=2981849 RepID=A0ABT3ZN04_9BURK|nr:dihydrofolate reductase family protein [Robbsia betulipollinis]MCY0387936.1 dihydrofolate reductase family protein [Robbsia betulipollinis]
MKPYIVCHMMSSIDGHSLTDGWHLKGASALYEETASQFKADGWICGRVTMQEVSHCDDYPRGLAKEPVPRTNHFVVRDAAQYAISIDPKGAVPWKSNVALKSHVVEVLSESVSDDFLAYLQSVGVSYVFGGKTEIDLASVLETLQRELGVGTLIVEGGAHVSGAFVNAGLVDEVSVLILPLVDGRGEHPASFEIGKEAWKQPAYMTLKSVDQVGEGAVWLRYATGAPTPSPK